MERPAKGTRVLFPPRIGNSSLDSDMSLWGLGPAVLRAVRAVPLSPVGSRAFYSVNAEQPRNLNLILRFSLYPAALDWRIWILYAVVTILLRPFQDKHRLVDLTAGVNAGFLVFGYGQMATSEALMSLARKPPFENLETLASLLEKGQLRISFTRPNAPLRNWIEGARRTGPLRRIGDVLRRFPPSSRPFSDAAFFARNTEKDRRTVYLVSLPDFLLRSFDTSCAEESVGLTSLLPTFTVGILLSRQSPRRKMWRDQETMARFAPVVRPLLDHMTSRLHPPKPWFRKACPPRPKLAWVPLGVQLFLDVAGGCAVILALACLPALLIEIFMFRNNRTSQYDSLITPYVPLLHFYDKV